MATLRILPEELIEEILVRVPAIILKRLRFVCKQWNALFNDRRFNEKHFIKAKQQFLMMKLAGNKVNQINLDLHGIRPTLKSSGTISFPDNIQVDAIFHCHGLLLCTTRDLRLFVWNPCLEQIRWIEDRDNNKYILSDCYSLGYDKEKKVYKILRFPDHQYINKPIKFRIFDLNTNSWRILDNVHFPNYVVRSCGISLKGNGFWAAKRMFGIQTSMRYFILHFDFTTERFRGLCSPPSYAHSMTLSNVRDERISVSMQTDFKVFEFWMSSKFDDEKVLCWNKLFTMDFNGDIGCFVTSFLLDTEKKLVVFSNKNNREGLGIIYVAKDGLGIVEVDKSAQESWMNQPFLLSYTPSLAGQTNLMRKAQIFLYTNGNDHPTNAIDLDKSLLRYLLFNQSPSLKDIALASVSMRSIPFAQVLEKLCLSDAKYGSVRRFYIETFESTREYDQQ